MAAKSRLSMLRFRTNSALRVALATVRTSQGNYDAGDAAYLAKFSKCGLLAWRRVNVGKLLTGSAVAVAVAIYLPAVSYGSRGGSGGRGPGPPSASLKDALLCLLRMDEITF